MPPMSVRRGWGEQHRKLLTGLEGHVTESYERSTFGPAPLSALPPILGWPD